jgi:hypothetical protein
MPATRRISVDLGESRDLRAAGSVGVTVVAATFPGVTAECSVQGPGTGRSVVSTLTGADLLIGFAVVGVELQAHGQKNPATAATVVHEPQRDRQCPHGIDVIGAGRLGRCDRRRNSRHPWWLPTPKGSSIPP